jgi:hypothetical protein
MPKVNVKGHLRKVPGRMQKVRVRPHRARLKKYGK